MATLEQVAMKLRLDEANAGIAPHLQNRDPACLAQIVCAWCGKLMRYAIWPQGGGLAHSISHGMCSSCRRTLEAQMEPTLSQKEYWAEQRRRARMEEQIEKLQEDTEQLSHGLAEQGRATIALRERLRQIEERMRRLVPRKEGISNEPATENNPCRTVSHHE